MSYQEIEERAQKIIDYVQECLELNNAVPGEAMIALISIVCTHTIQCGISKERFLELLGNSWDFYANQIEREELEPIDIIGMHDLENSNLKMR